MQENLINKEKIICDLKCCLSDDAFACEECPYYNEQDYKCKDRLTNDVVASLYTIGANFYPCQYCTRYECDKCLYPKMCQQNIYR